jgi:ubiquinone/menaquinone biosynthesis C-methylase UbiE
MGYMTSSDVEQTPRVSRPNDAISFQSYLLYQRHYYAYEAALARANDLDCFLDIACGYAPALDLVSQRCKQIVGVDVATTALEALPDVSNLTKRCEDATDLSIPDESVSVAVAFQLIEHVDLASAEEIIAEMNRVLKPGGRGFLTTPNARWRLLRNQKPWNKHHVHEFSPQGIQAFCERVGVPQENIYGVVGSKEAQRIEKARVKPSYLAHYGGRPGRMGARVLRKCGQCAPLRREAQRPVTQADKSHTWFQLSRQYEEGLDFWIEVHK